MWCIDISSPPQFHPRFCCFLLFQCCLSLVPSKELLFLRVDSRRGCAVVAPLNVPRNSKCRETLYMIIQIRRIWTHARNKMVWKMSSFFIHASWVTFHVMTTSLCKWAAKRCLFQKKLTELILHYYLSWIKIYLQLICNKVISL